MATDVVVNFVADTSKLQSEIGKVEGTGGQLKSWAKGVGAAIGGALVIDQLKDAVGAASELADQVGASGVIFGEAAKQVESFATEAATGFGISKTAALEGANTIAAFGKGAGLAGDDLATFSTDLVGLAGDLASFRGTSTEQAIGAVGAALRGESEPIRAYGVMLDDATLKARALSEGLVTMEGDTTKIASAQLSAEKAQAKYNAAVEEYGEASPEAEQAGKAFMIQQAKLGEATQGTIPDLTNQQKVLAAQAEIFAQTGDAQGDFARTSDSAANQQKQLKAQMENASAAIGTALLPVVQKLLPYLQQMATFVQENSGWLVPLAGAVLGIVAAVKAWSIAQGILNVVMAANPILLIVVAIAALVAAVVLAYQKVDWFRDAVDAAWQAAQAAFDAILGAAQEVFGWIKTNWPLLLAILTGPIGVVVLLITRNFETIKDAIETAFNWVRDNWKLLLAIITGPIGAAVLAITANFDTIKSAFTGVYDWIKQKVEAIAGVIEGVVGGIKTAVGKVVDAIKAPINLVIRSLNRLQFTIPKIEIDPPGPGPTLSAGPWTIDVIPGSIPELTYGGIVRQTGLAVVHEGERFSGVRGGMGGNTYNLNVNVQPGTDPARVGKTVIDFIRAYERANGTDWRTGAAL